MRTEYFKNGSEKYFDSEKEQITKKRIHTDVKNFNIPTDKYKRAGIKIETVEYDIKDRKYNGWTNYETWVVKLWLDNDEGSQELQREWLELAKHTPLHDVWTREETNKFTLAHSIQDYIEENNPLAEDASMYSDLMRAAINEINFNEIAEAIIEDN